MHRHIHIWLIYMFILYVNICALFFLHIYVHRYISQCFYYIWLVPKPGIFFCVLHMPYLLRNFLLFYLNTKRKVCTEIAGTVPSSPCSSFHLPCLSSVWKQRDHISISLSSTQKYIKTNSGCSVAATQSLLQPLSSITQLGDERWYRQHWFFNNILWFTGLQKMWSTLPRQSISTAR